MEDELGTAISASGCLRFLFRQRVQPRLYHFVKQDNSTSDLLPVRRFYAFVEASALHQRSEFRDVIRKKDGVMHQFLMALVAEYNGLSFALPRTRGEDSGPLFTLSVHRTPEETLGDMMMRSGVRPASRRSFGVGAVAV